VEFLANSLGDVLVTLIYHRPLDERWDEAGRVLQAKLGIQLIGRAKKTCRVLSENFVTEQLSVAGRDYFYQQVEASFTQPNARVNEQMLAWALAQVQGVRGDLLELYCGNGNFTCVLSQAFDKVLATEISKTSVASAQHNFVLNGVTNVQIARMSSEELTEALNGVREFRRLQGIDLASYDFSTIFVDPPRAGLDEGTRVLAAGFERIVYISCNPETLARDLVALCQTHQVRACAVFDQFPYSHHLESGVILVRKP
jgi:tRNA (uracil-5-)-methyltransferase